MINWQEKAKELENIPVMRERLEAKLRCRPKHYKPRAELLDRFFGEQVKPTDICIVLYSGLDSAFLLANHLEGNNKLFYRPLASHLENQDQFLVGTPNPERGLLIFDDMAEGNAMRETVSYLVRLGYNIKDMSGYLDLGFYLKDSGTPQLDYVGKLLKYVAETEIRKSERLAGVIR